MMAKEQDQEFWLHLLHGMEATSGKSPEELVAKIAELEQAAENVEDMRAKVLTALEKLDPEAHMRIVAQQTADEAEEQRLFEKSRTMARGPDTKQ
jgi:hypothetical protein